jgi:hypothetical protein
MEGQILIEIDDGPLARRVLASHSLRAPIKALESMMEAFVTIEGYCG